MTGAARRPEADPTTFDGLYWPNMEGRPPRVRMTMHRLTCPDGRRLLVRSQLIAPTGCVLDRWYSRGHLVATTVRGAAGEDSHTVPPEVRRVVEELPAAS